MRQRNYNWYHISYVSESTTPLFPKGAEIGKVVPPPIIKAFSLLLGEWEEANRESG